MRDAFADELARLARADERIMLLTGDLGFRLFDDFAASCPGRFLNMGVSEANMVSVAAGLSIAGMRPVTYSIVPFATARCFEQIRNDVCSMGLPVLIVGVGGGYAYGPNGSTHHGVDDVAILRVLPGMTILCPCDPDETRSLLREALDLEGPCYLRLGRNREPQLTRPNGRSRIGVPTTLREGGKFAILACGPIARAAVAAGEALAKHGIDTTVLSAHTVKPIDGLVTTVRERGFEHLVVVEEHWPWGGLAEALGVELATCSPQPRLTRLAAVGRFVHESGSQEYLWRMAGIDADGISRAILRVVEATE